jgi:hypothetical protein
MQAFGWPEAGENDAERAVHAALVTAEAVAATPVPDEKLRVRIGIATGLVVVGDQIGSGESREQTAIGETPNRAARLQALAAPGGIVIDAATRRQIGELFECQSRGAMPLKGLPEPVETFDVLAPRALQSRFEALRRTRRVPLIGREEELEILLRRWGQAKTGQGRLVLISGEPGIGKSRLLAALDERLRGESLTRLRYFCAPHQQASPTRICRWFRTREPGRGTAAQTGGAASGNGHWARGRGAPGGSAVVTNGWIAEP